MARHYSTRSFLRQIPNALLARYFTDRVLFCDLDFAAMKETKPDELFAAWHLRAADRAARRLRAGFIGRDGRKAEPAGGIARWLGVTWFYQVVVTRDIQG